MLIQSFFLFTGLLGLLLAKRLLLLSFLLKVGLPPFHIWLLLIVFFLKKNELFLFLSVHKVIPFFFFFKMIKFSKGTFFIFFIIMLLVFLVFELRGFVVVIISSSLIHSVWLFTTAFISLWLLMFYWLTYSYIVFFLFRCYWPKNFFLREFFSSSVSSIIWLIIRGLPPFTVFFLKASLIFLFRSLRIALRYFILLISVASLVFYYRVFHLSIGSKKFLKRRKISLFLGLFLYYP